MSVVLSVFTKFFENLDNEVVVVLEIIEMSMALLNDSEIYDQIVDQYSEAKSNLYKKHVEEPTFWKCAGEDFTGKAVLDLACGSGYYSRQFRSKGAKQVSFFSYLFTFQPTKLIHIDYFSKGGRRRCF